MGISESSAEAALDRLCVEIGFCLSPLWRARLSRTPPDSIESFVRAVFHAEGLDPDTTDSDLIRQVRDIVAAGFSPGDPPG